MRDGRWAEPSPGREKRVVVRIEQLSLPIAVAEPSAEQKERWQTRAFTAFVLLLEVGWIVGLGAIFYLLL